MADAILAQSGIYAITNKENGKQYVGSAVNLHKRRRRHIYELTNGDHHSIKLQRAWGKYGEGAFEFKILEVVPVGSELIAREQFWINALGAFGPSGYNMCPTAGSNLGIKRSSATIEKMRESGRRYVASAETREKLRIANTGKKASTQKLEKMRGMKKSPETLEKLRIANIGKKMSAEAIQKSRAASLGLKRSDEAKARMRAAKVGKKWTDAQRSAITATVTSAAHREKVGAASRGRKQSEETIAKRVEGTRRAIAVRMDAMTPAEREAYRVFRKPSPELVARRAESIRATWARKKALLAT